MAQSQLVLSAAQLDELRSYLAQLGQQATVNYSMLADLSGQDIVHWVARSAVDVSSIAALAAGNMMSTLEIGQMLGGHRSCNLVVQEYDEQTILIGRVGEGLLLLVATAKEVPLGWSRLAVKRTCDKILVVVGSAAMTPPPLAVTEDFAANFAAQINALW
jgi:predicted regulator of Ras-like GTPase activity (Roadblock/LC7/MglB family)